MVRETICTNALKQFIPNALNSRFLSEANGVVEEDAETHKRAGRPCSWGSALNPISPPLEHQLGRMGDDWQ